MSPGWQLCFDSDTHKALLNIILVLLLWAALTGATPLLNAPFDKTTDGLVVVGGLWFHIRLNPSYHKNTLKNKRLFGQSQSPGAWGSSVCLPRLSPLYSCLIFFFFFLSGPKLYPAHLDRTLNKTQEDLIPSHFPQEEYIQLQQPIVWIMITAPEEEERVEKGWEEKGRKVRNLTEKQHSVKGKTTSGIKRRRPRIKPDYHSSYSLDGERF